MHAANIADTTVVVPSWNRPELLPATLRSIRSQVGGPPRIVVVDDGSTEPVRVPDGVQLIRLDVSGGAGAARNAGLAAVETTWVAFCDDDDVWAPGKLAAQFDALARHPEARWSYAGAVAVDADLRVLGAQRARETGWIAAALLRENVVSGGGSTVLARTDLVRRVGGFAAGLHAAEDWDMSVRLAQEAQVVAVDRPLVAWRVHPGNKSGRWTEQGLAELADRLRPQAAEHGVRFDHAYAAQAVIDRAVASGDRRAIAQAYAARFRHGHAPRDAAAAVYGLLAPASLAAAKRRAHRRSVPAAWEGELAWLETLGQG